MKFFISALILLCSAISAFSQGAKFSELERKLEPYFADDLISDVKKQLPQGTDFTIWGWDVGDYSGDGITDVALSLRLSSDREKNVLIYLFVDLDGYLQKVGNFTYQYVEMPLEIGVAIKGGNCYITKKRKLYDWLIRSYNFNSGVLCLNDEYSTERIEDMTHETYKNYQTLQNSEKFVQTNNDKKLFATDFLTIPSYERGRLIYKGFNAYPGSNRVEYVNKGAYYWKGPEDCSFVVNSVYDEQNLYFTVTVTDDAVVACACDSCPCDFVELWIDAGQTEEPENRWVRKGKRIKFEEPAAQGIYNFKLSPGDFYEIKPYVKEFATSDDIDTFQREMVKSIKVVSSLKKNGYEMKFKIPFSIFGWEAVPSDSKNFTQFAATIVVHDVDNVYRPEEESQIATSMFDPEKPTTYGTLVLVPQEQWYGSADNVFIDEITKCLLENGF